MVATASGTAVPREWEDGMQAVRSLPGGGIALLIGATDQGKTTFAALAARLLAEEVENVAVVDTDIGQSEIGPPGTVGVAWARSDVERLSELKPSVKFFVGGFSPPRVGMELVSATGRAVAWAQSNKAGRILVDTTGFVSGPSARRIKVPKARLVNPTVILSFGDVAPRELTPALAAATGAPVVLLPTPAAVRRKPSGQRSTRRLTRLAAELHDAREIRLPLSAIATVGSTLGTGTALAPELLRWCAQTLRLPLNHAEISDDTLTLWMPHPPRRDWEAAAAPVTAHFRVQSLRVLSWSDHRNTYIGLGDPDGRLLSVGRFLDWDPERHELIVSAPMPAITEQVRLVEWGRVRLAADAQSQGDVRPGEL